MQDSTKDDLPAVRLEAAIAAFRAGRHGEAGALFRQLVVEHPAACVSYSYLGCGDRLESKTQSARIFYDRALRLNPDHWPARFYRTLMRLSTKGGPLPDTPDLLHFLVVAVNRPDVLLDSLRLPLILAALTVFDRDGRPPDVFVSLATTHPFLLAEAANRFGEHVLLDRFPDFLAPFAGRPVIALGFTSLAAHREIDIGYRVATAMAFQRTLLASTLSEELDSPEVKPAVLDFIARTDRELAGGEETLERRISVYQMLFTILRATSAPPVSNLSAAGATVQIATLKVPNRWPADILHRGLDDLPSVVLDSMAFPSLGADSSTPWVAFGSCFADNVANCINKTGRGRAWSFGIGEMVNNVIFNHALIRWIVEGPTDALGMFIDRHIGSFWALSREEARAKLEEARVVVITLGVSRTRWWEKAALPALTLGATFRPQRTGGDGHDRIILREIGVAETVAYLGRILECIAIGAPKTVVLSVSPVPLSAVRDAQENAIVADCLSKSTLRLAAQEFMEAHPGQVLYWPSFEIIKWLGAHVPYSTYIDASHPNPRLIERILTTFLEKAERTDAN